MRKNTANNMNNYHILIVKYVGMKNTMPAKVKIISERFKASIKIPYTNEAGSNNPTLETAEAWLIDNGYNIIGHGNGNGHDYIITDTFKKPTLKIEKFPL